MNRSTVIRGAALEFSKHLADEGKLIEAGWESFAHFVIAKDAPEIQLAEMRIAFMAGAQHLFASMVTIMDRDAEPTDDDVRRMELIHKELKQWEITIRTRAEPAKGSA